MRTERSFTYFIIFDFFSKQCSGTDPLPTSQACTPLAHEAISLPMETGIHPDGAVSLRSPLALASENPGGGALPAWVGTEMKSARHLAETGEQTVRLIKPNAPPRGAGPDHAACPLLKAAAQRRPMGAQRPVAPEAVRMLTDIDGPDDMLLAAWVPNSDFLRVQDPRRQSRTPRQRSASAGRRPASAPVRPLYGDRQ